MLSCRSTREVVGLSPEKFTAALVQMSCGPSPEENLQKAITRIGEAADKGANVVCLPELFQTQYFCQREDHALFDLAEPIPGPSTEILAAAAKKQGVVLVASLFEKRAPGVYHNTAAIFDRDGTLRGIYRKMHIPDDPLYYEKFYFTPGDLGFRSFDTAAGKIGTLVCWDQWYPEGGPPDRPARRDIASLPDRDWLASIGESGVRRSPVRRLEDDSARPRDRQRSVRRCCQSRRLRNR